MNAIFRMPMRHELAFSDACNRTKYGRAPSDGPRALPCAPLR
jgi:hypothetical protein